MPQLLALAAMAAPIMVILDLTWVGLVANSYYKSQLGSLFSPHPVAWALILFYVIYIFAMAYLVISPAVASHSLSKAIIGGIVLALAAYGTYDLVNLGITAGWPLQMTFVDMAWGVVVTTAASTGAYVLATKVFGF